MSTYYAFMPKMTEHEFKQTSMLNVVKEIYKIYTADEKKPCGLSGNAKEEFYTMQVYSVNRDGRSSTTTPMVAVTPKKFAKWSGKEKLAEVTVNDLINITKFIELAIDEAITRINERNENNLVTSALNNK